MKHLFYFCFFSFILILDNGCIPKTDTPITSVVTDLNDKELQTILTLQAKVHTDSMYLYLKHKNPAYRYQVLKAFSSLKGLVAPDSIYPLLNDPVMEVRAAAAFTLGQTGNGASVQKLLSAFRSKDTISVNNLFNSNILEAIGKIGEAKLLTSMASVRTYRATDTLLLLGQMKGIYRFMLRDMTDPEGSSTAIKLLKDLKQPQEIRLYAAQYFARGKETGVEKYTKDLVKTLNTTKEIELRLPIVLALGKTKDSTIVTNLKALLITTQDPRMKVNVIKALTNFSYFAVRLEIGGLLKDKNHHVALAASQFFLKNGIKEDLEYYQVQLNDSLHWKVKANMYGCLLKHAPIYNTKSKAYISTQIKTLFDKSNNPYEKAQLVFALSQDPFNYQLIEQLNDQNMAPVKVAKTEAYKTILTSPSFFKAFGYGYPKIKAYILDILAGIIQKGDPASTSVAALILREPSLGWREWIKDTEFLTESLKNIKVPEGLEAYVELDKTIHYLQNKEYKPGKSLYHKPIDWTVLLSSTDSSSVAVKTTKGTFRIRLHPKRAPFSVSNFLTLVEKKYFHQKIIHRVEPNFVTQTGCPRGDGYGSLDYTIPSELTSGNYTSTGLVGMASAGHNTECSQWFVTHSSAPHLDGNYTILGHITEGMDVVYNLDVGDKIIEVIFVR